MRNCLNKLITHMVRIGAMQEKEDKVRLHGLYIDKCLISLNEKFN